MSENPAQTAKDSKRSSENNIEQLPEPVDKQDPTKPVKASGSRESKGADL